MFPSYSFSPCIWEGFCACLSRSCKDVCGFIARFLQTSGLCFYDDCCCEDILEKIVFLFEIMFRSVDLSLDISGSLGITGKTCTVSRGDLLHPTSYLCQTGGGTGCFHLLN